MCPVRQLAPALPGSRVGAGLPQRAPTRRVAMAPVAQQPLGALARPSPPGTRHAASGGSPVQHRLPLRAVVHLPARQDVGERDLVSACSARAPPARGPAAQPPKDAVDHLVVAQSQSARLPLRRQGRGVRRPLSLGEPTMPCRRRWSLSLVKLTLVGSDSRSSVPYTVPIVDNPCQTPA